MLGFIWMFSFVWMLLGRTTVQVLLSSAFISLLRKGSFIFTENVVCKCAKMAYQNFIRKRTSIISFYVLFFFLCMFFFPVEREGGHVINSSNHEASTSAFRAWAVFYLWANVFTWSSWLKFTTGPNENYLGNRSFPTCPSSSLQKLKYYMQVPFLLFGWIYLVMRCLSSSLIL